MNYKNDTYSCEMCLWAEQCPGEHTCDDYSPLDEFVNDTDEEMKDEYRATFLRYADFDNGTFGDWGYSYFQA